MWRQYFVHVHLILLRWQLIEQNYVVSADRVFGRGAEAHQVRGEACPGRLLLVLLFLLFQLLVKDLDKVDQSFLAESNLSFFLCSFVHFDLNFLGQLVLIFEQHVESLDQ